jgi:DNA-directed RNA polymerase specialized sigma24 family protein
MARKRRPETIAPCAACPTSSSSGMRPAATHPRSRWSTTATAGPAYGRAVCLCGDPRLAEDVVQDAFLTVWRNAAMFDCSRGSARTWILAIVQHRAIDALRRQRRHLRVRASADGLEDRLEAPADTDVEVLRRELRDVGR